MRGFSLDLVVLSPLYVSVVFCWRWSFYFRFIFVNKPHFHRFSWIWVLGSYFLFYFRCIYERSAQKHFGFFFLVVVEARAVSVVYSVALAEIKVSVLISSHHQSLYKLYKAFQCSASCFHQI